MATTIKSGIYLIRNILNGKCYVGSSKNLEWRKHRHFTQLRNGDHHCSHLQRSFLKHGEDAFVFVVVEMVADLGKLIEREQHWIDETKKNVRLYNSAMVAGSQLGIKRSEETIQKMRLAQKGKVIGEEARKKMSKAKLGTCFRKGKKASDDTRKRISDSKKGTVVSDETRKLLSQKRIGNKNALGHKQTSDTIAKRMESSRLTRMLKKSGAPR